MPGYLLSTEALIAFCQAETTPATKVKDWLNSLTPRDQLFASELSLGEMRSGIEEHPDYKQREIWRHYIDQKIPSTFAARLLPFKDNEIREWGLIRTVGGEDMLPAEETQIIGQAIANDLIYVGPRTRVHEMITIQIHDPYDGMAWPEL